VTATIAWLLIGAAASVLVAGLAAGVEAALARISRVRAAELLERGEPGAARLVRLTADAARYVNLVLLIRVVGEMAAAVMVAMVCVHRWGLTLGAGAIQRDNGPPGYTATLAFKVPLQWGAKEAGEREAAAKLGAAQQRQLGELNIERVEIAQSEYARAAFAEFLRGTRKGILQRAFSHIRRRLA